MTNSLIHGYAVALLDSGEQGLARVRALLARKGHSRLWHRILSEASRLAQARAARTGSTLVLARATDAARYQEAITRVRSELGAGDNSSMVIDPSIGGGFLLTRGYERIDRTLKRSLINLYHRVITQ